MPIGALTYQHWVNVTRLCTRARILVQVTIYRRLRIGGDGPDPTLSTPAELELPGMSHPRMVMRMLPESYPFYVWTPLGVSDLCLAILC